jgi:hypothetical protein
MQPSDPSAQSGSGFAVDGAGNAGSSDGQSTYGGSAAAAVPPAAPAPSISTAHSAATRPPRRPIARV